MEVRKVGVGYAREGRGGKSEMETEEECNKRIRISNEKHFFPNLNTDVSNIVGRKINYDIKLYDQAILGFSMYIDTEENYLKNGIVCQRK